MFVFTYHSNRLEFVDSLSSYLMNINSRFNFVSYRFLPLLLKLSDLKSKTLAFP